MDTKDLISPLISVVVTAVISAIRDPVGRAFENSTKRVQFWKTMLETCSLADLPNSTIASSLKEQCRHEMAEATDVVTAATNRLAGILSIPLFLSLCVLVISLIVRAFIAFEDGLHQDSAPQSFVNQLGYTSALVQLS